MTPSSSSTPPRRRAACASTRRRSTSTTSRPRSASPPTAVSGSPRCRPGHRTHRADRGAGSLVPGLARPGHGSRPRARTRPTTPLPLATIFLAVQQLGGSSTAGASSARPGAGTKSAATMYCWPKPQLGHTVRVDPADRTHVVATIDFDGIGGFRLDQQAPTRHAGRERRLGHRLGLGADASAAARQQQQRCRPLR